MDDKLLSSSELFQTFPRVKKNDSLDDQHSEEYNGFPKFIPPKSKYSSTETELSSEDDSAKIRIRRDSSGIMTLSGLTTSTSSSGLSRKRKRKRRRKQEKLSLPKNESESGHLYLSIRSQGSAKSSTGSFKKSHSERSWNSTERRSLFPPLNSVNDLKHATGRHRGISGSFSPAVDSILFAMFYTTDVFDYLFYDNEVRHFLMESENNRQMKRDIFGTLRKEIVYSLRSSYFCPAEKIVKLLRILEDNFPLERFQDPANFVDLLFSKIVNPYRHLPAFINYSNGSSNYIFQLPLNGQLWFSRKNSNFEGAILTIQNLLEVCVNRECNDLVGGSKFTTVPYPVFIIQVMRGSKGIAFPTSSEVYYDNNDDIHLSGPRPANRCDNGHTQNYPVIPNMEIDLTNLMTQNGHNNTPHKQVEKSSKEDETILSSSHMMASTEKYFGSDLRDIDSGRVGVIRESRLLRGLKTAWKRMYRYLEDFASSPSTHFPSAENSFMDNYNESGGLLRPSLSSMQSSFFPRSDDNHHHFQLSRSPSPSSSSSLSFMSCSTHPRHHEIEESPSSIFSAVSSSKKRREVVPQVKMELIAVICKSGGNVCGVCSNSNDRQRSKLRNSTTSGGGSGDDDAKVFSGYSVYCKAKSKSDKIGGEYAPWVLHQSRCGVAPQVTLIENFGKWISSLERNREDLNLYHVPLEIRRVMEDSELLIYQRIENSS